MIKKFFGVVLLVCFFASPVTVLGASYFYRDLEQGSAGEDVRLLQQILNRDKATQINSFGLCSPGQETDYFNTITKVAVIKFQEKYRAEVLTPLGLKNGTGYVGRLTRQKLNSLLGQNKTTSTPVFTPIVPTVTSTRPVINKISPDSGQNGTKITIEGSGFAPKGNSVVTTFGIFDGLDSPDGKTISFVFQPPTINSIEGFTGDDYDDRVNKSSVGSLPVVMVVKNAGGASDPVMTFKLIFK